MDNKQRAIVENAMKQLAYVTELQCSKCGCEFRKR